MRSAGDSIHVDAARRDALRMELAGEASLQQVSADMNCSMACQGSAPPRRCSMPPIGARRKASLRARSLQPLASRLRACISRSRAPAVPARTRALSASVTVTMAGGTLSVVQARAFKHLVASAVSGMSPEDVSVIDTQGGLIQTGSDEAGADPAGNDRAAELRRNVERHCWRRVLVLARRLLRSALM